jgi:hypothetical protein
MKRCSKCLAQKPLDAFYAHPRSAEGRSSKCKECTKADVRANRTANLQHYREFDRLRASMPHRVAAQKEYAKTEQGKARHRQAILRNLDRHPERKRATEVVNYALRAGRLLKTACEVCGERKVEAHHPDYSRPLMVVWLCKAHHVATHKLARELQRSTDHPKEL